MQNFVCHTTTCQENHDRTVQPVKHSEMPQTLGEKLNSKEEPTVKKLDRKEETNWRTHRWDCVYTWCSDSSTRTRHASLVLQGWFETPVLQTTCQAETQTQTLRSLSCTCTARRIMVIKYRSKTITLTSMPSNSILITGTNASSTACKQNSKKRIGLGEFKLRLSQDKLFTA